MDNTGRPDVITIWQKHGRKYDAMPDVSDKLSEYTASWWKWWQLVQPSWRLGDGLLLSRQLPSNIDWSATEKGTSNGFFIILLGLGLWALGLKHSDDSPAKYYDDFSRAIGDTAWVLRQMRLASTGEKRARQDDESSTSIARKRFATFSVTDYVIH